jgi:tetratricopeptide (TPR) repeat protein
MYSKGYGFVLATFLLIPLLSPALAASPEGTLLGKWRGKEGKIIEFCRDGTLIVNNQGARYRIIDKERMEIDLGEIGWLSELGRRPIVRFTITGDGLTLIPLAKPAEAEKLRRVKVDASGMDAVAYFNRARNVYSEAAIKDCDKAIKLDPEYVEAYVWRGILYYTFDKEGYQRAIKDFDKAIKLDPEYVLTFPDPNHTKRWIIARCYLGRGDAYGLLGDYQQAIKDYDKAIELDPNDAEAYDSRGDAYSLLGNYRQAIRDYDKAMQVDPKHPDRYAVRGDAYSLLGNYKEAINDCNQAIDRSGPCWGFLYSIRGVVYARSGNYEQAIKDCETAIVREPETSWCYVAMAVVYSLQKNAQIACQWLQRAIEKGFNDWAYLKANRDFDGIRDTPCFREIIESIRSKQGK